MDNFANWTKYCPRNNEKIGNQIVKISEYIRVQDGYIESKKKFFLFFIIILAILYWMEHSFYSYSILHLA